MRSNIIKSVPAINTTTWQTQLIWLVVTVVGGLAIPAVFAGQLKLNRNWFLIPYVLLAGAFVAFYLRSNDVDLGNLLLKNWALTLVFTVLAGGFLVMNVLSQESSPRAKGMQLIIRSGLARWSLWHPGCAAAVSYPGACCVAVVPGTGSGVELAAENWLNVLALAGSALVTAAYHWGYPEFRGKEVIKPAFGVAINTLVCLITGNPLASIGSHMMMHMAAVLHGPATTIQLPPHY